MKLGSNWRVGAEFGGDRWITDTVTIVGETDDSTYNNVRRARLTMTPGQARSMAIRLKKAADALDPPKPRRRKS